MDGTVTQSSTIYDDQGLDICQRSDVTCFQLNYKSKGGPKAEIVPSSYCVTNIVSTSPKACYYYTQMLDWLVIENQYNPTGTKIGVFYSPPDINNPSNPNGLCVPDASSATLVSADCGMLFYGLAQGNADLLFAHFEVDAEFVPSIGGSASLQGSTDHADYLYHGGKDLGVGSFFNPGNFQATPDVDLTASYNSTLARVELKAEWSQFVFEDELGLYFTCPIDCTSAGVVGQNSRFLARVPVAPTPNLVTFQFSADPAFGTGNTTVFNSLVSNTWDDIPMELQFPAGRTFKVASILDASNITFTAADANAGWAGLRMEEAVNTSFDNIIVEQVKAGTSGYGAGITYIDSEPHISNSTIRNSIGPNVDGIYLGGSAQIGLADQVFVNQMSGHGISLQGNFDYFRFVENTISGNNGKGFAMGYGSSAFLGNNTVQNNAGQGLEAYAAYPYLAADYAGQLGDNRFLSNVLGGASARAGTVLRGGTTGAYRRNSLVENGQPGPQWQDELGNAKEGPDAWARNTGTIAHLRNNWWGRPANPDTTSCSTIPCSGTYGAMLFVDPMLQSAPAGGNLLKGGGSSVAFIANGSDGAALGSLDGSPSRARASLLEASDANDAGRRADALRTLECVIIANRGSTPAAAALSEVGQLINEERLWRGSGITDRALALLRESATDGLASRAAALATLAKVSLVSGDLPRAVEAADELASMDDRDAKIAGNVARFYAALAGADRQSGASAAANRALGELDRLAPEGTEATLARQALAMLNGTDFVVPSRLLAQSDATLKNGAGTTELEEGHVTVWPNPSTGEAAVRLSVAEDADSKIELLDIRGRVVALLQEGRLERGEHQLAIPSNLPAGVYVVRSRLGGVVAAQRLSVVR